MPEAAISPHGQAVEQPWWYPFPDLQPRLEDLDVEVAKLQEQIHRAKQETINTTNALTADTWADLCKLETAYRTLANLREITAGLDDEQTANVLRGIHEEARQQVPGRLGGDGSVARPAGSTSAAGERPIPPGAIEAPAADPTTPDNAAKGAGEP